MFLPVTFVDGRLHDHPRIASATPPQLRRETILHALLVTKAVQIGELRAFAFADYQEFHLARTRIPGALRFHFAALSSLSSKRVTNCGAPPYRPAR